MPLFVYVTYTTISSNKPFVNHYFDLFYGVAQLLNCYGVAYIVVVTVVIVVVDDIVVVDPMSYSVCSIVVVEESEQHERMVLCLDTVVELYSRLKTMVTSSGAYCKCGFSTVNLS